MNHETNPLLAGMQARTQTWNSAEAFSTTMNACLDFFAKAPMASVMEFNSLFDAAWAENPELTTQLSFWLRDPRQGAGRRQLGRMAFEKIVHASEKPITDPTRIAEHGRWDDLLYVGVDRECLRTWIEAARTNPLAAKWLPREKSKKVGKIAKEIAKSANMTLKEYREFCSKHTKVIETQMCQNQWGEIEYSHVPSQAFRKLSSAFKRNDSQRFDEFIESANRGEVKISAGAVYPHEVIQKTLSRFGGWKTSELYPAEEAQWKNLPNFFNGPCSTIVVADTSGSMFCGENSTKPIEISLALALYCAEKMEGPFKDNFITFSTKATLHYLDPEKSVADRIAGIKEIVSNTDLMSVYNLILSTAKTLKIKQEDLPENVLIISDMQFDAMVDNSIPHQKAKEMFEKAGYRAPNLIYWNVANAKALPITHNEAGAAIVSGYSPSVLKAVFSGDLDPMSVMRRALEIYPSTLQ